MSQDENPYQPPQASLSVESVKKTPPPSSRKAGPLFRLFAGIIGILLVINGFASFSTQIMYAIMVSLLLFIGGVQFIVAGVTGYWYSWTGRRLE